MVDAVVVEGEDPGVAADEAEAVAEGVDVVCEEGNSGVRQDAKKLMVALGFVTTETKTRSGGSLSELQWHMVRGLHLIRPLEIDAYRFVFESGNSMRNPTACAGFGKPGHADVEYRVKYRR